jgi:hypothetical protein
MKKVLIDSKWAQAIQEEIEALWKNNTWRLIQKPERKKDIAVQIARCS